MQIELKIREILTGEGNVKSKVNNILKFMNWDEKKLYESILRYGVTKEGKDSIIKEFWVKRESGFKGR